MIIPIVPDDQVGVEDIVEETASLLNFGLVANLVPRARIVVNNRHHNDNYEQLYQQVYKQVEAASIDEFLSNQWLPFVNLAPFDFTSDEVFLKTLRSVLSELGI